MSLTQPELKNICNGQISNDINRETETFDDSKRIRLNDVRKMRLTDQELILKYKEWVVQDEYLILKKTNFDLKNRESTQIFASKCSKRGNDVYDFRIRNTFRELDEVACEMSDNGEIFDLHKSDKKTNVLLVTLSQDTKLRSSEESWDKIDEKYNRFITRMRKLYGKISVLRVWESYENGYPHIHAILIFDSYSFSVLEHWNRDHTKSTFRLKNRTSFGRKWVDGDWSLPIDDRVNLEDTKQIWNSEFVDVIAVHSIRGIVNYLSKYFRKFATNEDGSSSFKSDLTLAKTWYYRKQSFAMSGDFVEKLKSIRLVKAMHNSNFKNHQVDLVGDEVTHERCQLLGICSKKEMVKCFSGKNNNSWFLELDDVPKMIDDVNFDSFVVRSSGFSNSGIPIPLEDILNGFVEYNFTRRRN